MKLNSLQSLKALGEIKELSVPKRIITPHKSPYLSEIEILSYASNICFFAGKLLREEIIVKNSNVVINMAMKEVANLNSLLSSDEMELIPRKEVKETFKKLGVKPRHLKLKHR